MHYPTISAFLLATTAPATSNAATTAPRRSSRGLSPTQSRRNTAKRFAVLLDDSTLEALAALDAKESGSEASFVSSDTTVDSSDQWSDHDSASSIPTEEDIEEPRTPLSQTSTTDSAPSSPPPSFHPLGKRSIGAGSLASYPRNGSPSYQPLESTNPGFEASWRDGDDPDEEFCGLLLADSGAEESSIGMNFNFYHGKDESSGAGRERKGVLFLGRGTWGDGARRRLFRSRR